MDKTNGSNTPGGKPSINSGNPPSMEAGLKDSGEGHSLLTNYLDYSVQQRSSEKETIIEESTIREENEKLRAKISEIEIFCTEMKKEIHILRMKNDKLKMLKMDHNNNGRTQLEDNMSVENCTNDLKQPSSTIIEKDTIKNTNVVQEYHTDEDELAWETSAGWPSSKKRLYKKRKAVSSPEETAEPNKEDKLRESKMTQDNEQGTTVGSFTSTGKTMGKEKAKIPPFNLINVKEYNIIMEIISMLNKDPAPIITKGAEGKYKINVYSEEDFRTLSNILEKKNIEWFNYENKSERPNKVMMRGLDGSVDTEDIKLALTEMGFNIIDVSNIHIKKVNRVIQMRKLRLRPHYIC